MGRPVICRVSNKESTVEDFSDGTYVEIPFAIENAPSPRTIDLNYWLFFDVNFLHRGLMRLDFLAA